MRSRLRLPLGVIAAALFGLLVVLAMLQYRWMGQISDADRDQRRLRLTHDAAEFAHNFDRELARAYLLFQGEPMPDNVAEDMAARFARRYEHWQSTSAFPRMLKDVYVFSQSDDGASALQRFDPAARRFVNAEWPPSMSDWREHFASEAQQQNDPGRGTMFVRRVAQVVWERVPALVVPSPMFFFATAVRPGADGAAALADLAKSMPGAGVNPALAYSILVIDKDYVTREVLPALARRHFRQRGAFESASEASDPSSSSNSGATSLPLDFKVAVVARSASDGAPVFQSTDTFAPAYNAKADAAVDLFQIRTQDLSALVPEVRKITTVTQHHIGAIGTPPNRIVTTESSRPLSLVIQQGAGPVVAGARAATTTRLTATGVSPLWRLIVAHPSGSLDQAVNAARWRNLMVSFSILAILGASMGLLVLTTRRAQRLAQQQTEFVATVSHELRTPLAVIRSAAENLADGVIEDEEKIRRYGELMRTEGRRLTEMVEQILEIAGIQSGQRGFALRPVPVEPLIRDIVSSCSSLIERAGVTVEIDVPPMLAAVLGDEPALRRLFQNLVDNAIKYGASGGSIRIAAQAAGGNVMVSVADRGIGIELAEQSRIFEPFYRAPGVVAAQTQGAGLGLSLVQKIVAAHGGVVTVKSAPRDGSEFIVQLPAARSEPVSAAAEAKSPTAAPRYS